jgi:peptidoglycan/LPS O-acetylase OafA/YrhL
MHNLRGHFRQDINALRALSVIAVVGFHLKIPGFAGGFSGVDIFLVITGYLMTRKILSDLSEDRFSLFHFWTMRMRRIYPALAVVVVACVAVGWFVTMSDQYLKHLLQALSALAFVSNFAFSDANGYFAMAAQTKPLLHTWSLSVEWQFYLWMPLGAWLIWSRSRNGVRSVQTAFFTVSALSLAWCLWQSHIDNTASSFFSLTARAWEPLAGGLIAISEARHGSDRQSAWKRLGAVAGWLLLIGCVVYPFSEANWPSLATIFPVAGAVMVVSARRPVTERNILSASFVQRLGDWSYSIYLWHWPVWVFAIGWLSLHGYPVGIEHKAALVVLSITLGAASYYWIEQPVRLRKDVWTPRILLRGSTALFSACAALVGLAFLNNGFPSRLPKYLQPAELARRMNTPRDECFRNSRSVKSAPETYCSFGRVAAGSTPAMMLWGDSFANQYLEPISASALERGIHGVIATQSGCRAFVDSSLHALDSAACRAFNRETLGYALSKNSPEIVAVGSNWGDAREIVRLVDRLLAADKTIILIMPLLDIGFDVPQRWIENQVRAGHAIEDWPIEVSASLTMQKLRAEIRQLVLQAHGDDPRLIIADPQAVVCGDAKCWLVRNGQANFRDTAHISNVTAMQYKEMFDKALMSIAPPVAAAGTN